MEKQQEWVGTKFVAEALGISMSKARKLVEAEMTVFVVGSRWKILREDADRVIEAVRQRGWV
jgi:hypothetical protein